jgi:hypothetical protein
MLCAGEGLTAEICSFSNFEPLYLRPDPGDLPWDPVSWFSTNLYYNILKFHRNRCSRLGWALKSDRSVKITTNAILPSCVGGKKWQQLCNRHLPSVGRPVRLLVIIEIDRLSKKSKSQPIRWMWIDNRIGVRLIDANRLIDRNRLIDANRLIVADRLIKFPKTVHCRFIDWNRSIAFD